MFGVNLIGIIADDLTGANDTALQFHMHGCNTQIVLNSESSLNETNLKNAQACAISTETRNSDFNSAYQKTKAACQKLYDNFNIEYLYKKIDSTLRGNIAVEIKAILDVVNNDAAIVVPAFPKENRYTIGSYHLLKGVPIERTELARDPKFPIYESHIPSILEKQLKEFGSDLKIGTIGFKTVVKGAALILTEMHRLINEGVKIIVIDAQSSIDLEQIALAVKKSIFKLLPVGAAGFAAAAVPAVMAKSRGVPPPAPAPSDWWENQPPAVFPRPCIFVLLPAGGPVLPVVPLERSPQIMDRREVGFE